LSDLDLWGAGSGPDFQEMGMVSKRDSNYLLPKKEPKERQRRPGGTWDLGKRKNGFSLLQPTEQCGRDKIKLIQCHQVTLMGD